MTSSRTALLMMLTLLTACAAHQQQSTCSPWPECTGDTRDSDGDGILDLEDNCPRVTVRNQSDDDGDHIGDFCDNCVNVPNQEQEDEDDDGFGDVCDTGDNVPTMLSLSISKGAPRTVRRFRLPPGTIMPVMVDVQSASDNYACVHLEGYADSSAIALALETPHRQIKGILTGSPRIFVQEVVEWQSSHAMRYDLAHTEAGQTPSIILDVDVGGCVYAIDPNFVPPVKKNGDEPESHPESSEASPPPHSFYYGANSLLCAGNGRCIGLP